MAGNLQKDNELIGDLDRRFASLVAEQKIPLLAGMDLFENKFIVRRFFGLLSDERVVNAEDSASYFGEYRIVPDSDHFSIAKPTSIAEPSHKNLWEFYETRFRPLLLKSVTEPKTALIESLSKLMGTPPERVNINLPPAVGRHPGTLLARPAAGNLLVVRAGSQAVNRGQPVAVPLMFDLGAAEWPVAGVTPFQLPIVDANKAHVAIVLTELRVLEIAGGLLGLRRSLIADEDVRRQRARGTNTEVVTRALEAKLSFKVDLTNSPDKDILTKGLLASPGAKVNREGIVEFSAANPAVIAFETATVQFVTDSLAPGAPNEVLLTPTLSHEPAGERRSASPADDRHDVGFVALATSKYRNPELGDLPAANASTKLVSAVFQALGGINLFPDAIVRDEWSSAELLDIFSKAKKIAQERKLRGLVVYYIGHSALSELSQPYLILGSFQASPNLIMGGEPDKTDLEATTRKLLHDSGEIIEGLNAGGRDEAPEIAGTLAVQAIYDLLKPRREPLEDSEGPALALLVDGCSVANGPAQVAALFDEQDFGNDLRSSGTLWALVDLIREYGTPLFFSAEDPVIFASPPGQVARVTTVDGWGEFGVKVGPIAARLAKIATALEGPSMNDITWGSVFAGLIDSTGSSRSNRSGIYSESELGDWPEIRLLSPARR